MKSSRPGRSPKRQTMTARVGAAAIIGAGIAGLACAGELARAGVSVTIFEKGRRVGGRVATRRAEGVLFNHGAQFATARGPGFSELLADLEIRRRAAPWTAAGRDGRRIAFLPGMSALPAAMAERAAALGVRIVTERHAASLNSAASGWSVQHFPASDMRPGETAESGGELTHPYDAVLIALPSSQAAALLATAPHPFADAAARAVMAPCWAIMARFASPVAGRDVVMTDDDPIAWAAREGSRPGRAAEPDAWTLHASAAWSREHLEDDEESVVRSLLGAFRALAGASSANFARAHRWRHALVETAIGAPSLWDGAERLGACGDWCLGGRIEAAYDSGVSLARRVL